MTLVTIDLGDVAGGHDPDDYVVIRAEAFRESQGGGITSTAEVKIPLVDGVGQAEVEPGPVVVSFRCQAVADTREKRGVVPDSGTAGIENVLSESMVYTAPVVSRALSTINGAVGVAVAGEMGQAVRQATTSAVSAEQAAVRADGRASSAEIKVNAYTPRVEALELMGGLAPGEPADGQTANLVAQPDTLTRKNLNAGFIQVKNRPINLADRIPVGHVPSDDATPWINQALSESDVVEWPQGLALNLADPAGITIQSGQILRGGAGATATVNRAGPGVRLFGTIEGILIDRPSQGVGLTDVAVWVMPGSTGATARSVRASGGHTAAVSVGGSADTIPGVASSPVIDGVIAENLTGTSSYGYRLDQCTAPTLINSQSHGADVDNIKARVHVTDLRVLGGLYRGSRGGDGLDAFAGLTGGYIGGGVIFEDNSINNIVIKTDFLEEIYAAGIDPFANPSAAKAAVQAQINDFGLPRQTVVSGVICRRAGMGGVTFHRTDGLDSDVSAGWPMPWLADLLVSNLLIDTPGGVGLGINAYNAMFSQVQVLNAHTTGVQVMANARQIRMNQVAVRGAGRSSTGFGLTKDSFVLAGRDVWLSQCFADGAQHGAWSSDDDISSATAQARVGFNSVDASSAATHHFAQCVARHHTAGSLSVAAQSHARHSDGDYAGLLAGTSLGGLWLRSSGGALEQSATGDSAAGAWGPPDIKVTTSANLTTASHPINTTGKLIGTQVWASDTNKLYVSGGTSAPSWWYEVGTTNRISPV